MFLIFKCVFIYLKEQQRNGLILAVGSFHSMPSTDRTEPDPRSEPRTTSGSPLSVVGPKHFSHHSLLPRMHEQEKGSEATEVGLEPVTSM